MIGENKKIQNIKPVFIFFLILLANQLVMRHSDSQPYLEFGSVLKTCDFDTLPSWFNQLFNAPVTGDIAIGDIADLVLWSGDPLELTSEAELVMIEGEIIPMKSRSLQLRDRYFDRLKQ